MNYYRAYETEELPKLLFQFVADSIDQLEAMGMTDDPLVVAEDRLLDPEHSEFISYEYGICHQRIFNGQLADRPTGEITAQQAVTAKASEVSKTTTLEQLMDASTFDFDGKEFPLTPAARSVYEAVIAAEPGSVDIISTTGTYSLANIDLSAFSDSYYARILQLNEAVISG